LLWGGFCLASRDAQRLAGSGDGVGITRDLFSGRVVDTTGAGVGRAVVWIAIRGAPRTSEAWVGLVKSVSDANGDFAFGTNPDTTYLARYSELGVWAEGKGSASRQRLIRPKGPGKAVAVGLLVLESAVSMAVAVKTEGGEAVAGAQVALRLTDPSMTEGGTFATEYGYESVTDPEGRIVFESVYLPVNSECKVDVRSGALPLQRFRPALTADPHARGTYRVDLAIEEGASVSGRVEKADGEPAIGWRVAAQRPRARDPALNEWVTIDASGRFSLTRRVLRGSEVIVCTGRQVGPMRGSVSRMPLAMVPVDTSGGDVDMGTIRLPETDTLYLKVMRRAEPVTDGWIYLRRADRSHGNSSYRLQEGAVAIADVPMNVALRASVRVSVGEDREVEEEFEIPAGTRDRVLQVRR
jgi:hypothetical protein